ncbi:MAG TPA: class I SAM-dependent methyltransferase [Desulfosporosinus sp.]|nr:class I SAM-dependent methyltransferase [Desulfosporosinus sp.]
MKLNVGSGFRKIEDYVNIDNRESVKPDVVADLSVGFPFKSDSIEEVRAHDFLEHIPLGKTIGAIEEIFRVLKPDGFFEHSTPSTDGRGAFMDPTHLSFWNINSWLYFCNPGWNIYNIKARFGVIKLEDKVTDEVLNIVHTHGLMYAIKESVGLKSWSEINGWFSLEEGKALMSLAKGKDCLEIGSYKGRSTVALASVARSVFAIDTFKASGNGQMQMLDFTTIDEFLLNIKGFNNVEYKVGSSQDVLPSLDKQFDLVFIDGMHSYDQVKLDIQLSWGLIKDDGFFAFHDYAHPPVNRAIMGTFDPEKISSVEGFAWCKKGDGRMK